MLFNATSGVISGTPSLYAVLADETRFFIEGTYNQYTISTSFIMQLKSMICHYYFYNYLDHDELPVSSGLSGCYLSFSTSCFVEEESFYSTRPFDICKSESSIDFSDDFVAGSGGHSWVGLPESYSPLVFLYSVLASLIISQQHSMAILMPLLLEIILFIWRMTLVLSYILIIRLWSIMTDAWQELKFKPPSSCLKVLLLLLHSIVRISLYSHSLYWKGSILHSSSLLLYIHNFKDSSLCSLYHSRYSLSIGCSYLGGVPPSFLTYKPISLFLENTYTNILPSYRGLITHFEISPPLPSGLFLNPTTGEIYGTPSVSSLPLLSIL